ncbi:MAG: hypothetical protein HRU19_09510 [Pseudobacteriovorax sp.]|nr:hypothetical protein [Pseudobacteriovorax sp.]
MLDLTYRYEEAIDIYDLMVKFSIQSPRQETIVSSQSMVDEETQGQQEVPLEEEREFEQERRLMQAGIYLGTRSKLSLLSTSDNWLRSEWRFALGPVATYYNREVLDVAFTEPQNENLFPGLSMISGIDSILTYHLFKFGIEIELTAHKNFTNESNTLITSGAGTVYLGTFW